MEQQQSFVEQLKKLFSKTGIVANRPRGRPRKTGVSKEQVKPSKVPKKERLRAKKKLDIILDAHPLLKQLVEEYQKLIRSKMNASRYAQDLVTFRERAPTKKELQLMPEYALPSKLDIGISTGKVDIKEYKREMKKYSHFKILGYELKNFTRAPDISIERLNLDEEQYLKLIREHLTVELQKDMNEGEIKPGFYMSLRIYCTFSDKDNGYITMWLSSLTHRRDEVYVSTRRDIYKVLGLLLLEIRIRLIEVEGSSSDMIY